MLYQEKFPEATIYSFEPVRSTYGQLVNATSEYPRIRAHRCGMGRTKGEATINVSAWDTNSSILHAAPGSPTENIEINTISSFCEEHGIETIDFLKLDTEGYELEVLAGALPMFNDERIGLVYVECEPFPTNQTFVSLSEVGEFLRPLGYELFGIYDQTPFWDGRKALFFFNAVFIAPKLISPKK